MEPAHLGVEVTQTGGKPGYMAGAPERTFCALDRLGQRKLEAHETAGYGAVGGKLEQRMFGRLDLLRAVEFGIDAEGVIDHRLADIDQLSPQPCVLDRPAIFAGIDDADHGGEKLRQIGRAADLLQHAGMLEFGFQRDRVGELSGFNAAGDRLIDAAVDRIGEVFGGKEF